MTTKLTEHDCLDHGHGPCSGPVEYRHPMSSTGRSFARCERHFEKRLREQERIQRTYGSPGPPAWFDEAAAGERWEEDC